MTALISFSMIPIDCTIANFSLYVLVCLKHNHSMIRTLLFITESQSSFSRDSADEVTERKKKRTKSKSGSAKRRKRSASPKPGKDCWTNCDE